MIRRNVRSLMFAVLAGAAAMAGPVALADDSSPNPAGPSPLWWHVPEQFDIDHMYPSAADKRGIPGAVTLVCRASSVELTGCRVESEEPAGLGFGKAALFLSRLFTIDADASPGSGHEVRIRIDFTPPRRALLEPQAGDGQSLPGRNIVYWDNGPSNGGGSGEGDYTKRRVSGRTLVRCRVEPTGALSNCAVVSDDPPGLGFGKGALASVRNLTLARKALDGSPTAGRLVDVPVIFNEACASFPDPSRIAACLGRASGLPHGSSGYRPQY